MPTYAQLQAESWWGREVTTPEIDWLGDELCRRTGRPRAAFGNKGDNHHLRGAHRSQDWIERSRYCTSRTYTVQSGLTAAQKRHIAGVDFTPGSANQMVAQCKRIYAAMKAGRLNEVREFYGNVDGDQRVDGWDNVDDEPASSDSSHLWHWHLSIDRRHCANRSLMERILAIALGDDLEDDDMDAEQFRKILADPAVAAQLRALSVQYPVYKDKSLLTVIVEADERSKQVAADVAAIKARPAPGTISDEQLERVLRKVVRSVPES